MSLQVNLSFQTYCKKTICLQLLRNIFRPNWEPNTSNVDMGEESGMPRAYRGPGGHQHPYRGHGGR